MNLLKIIRFYYTAQSSKNGKRVNNLMQSGADVNVTDSRLEERL